MLLSIDCTPLLVVMVNVENGKRRDKPGSRFEAPRSGGGLI